MVADNFLDKVYAMEVASFVNYVIKATGGDNSFAVANTTNGR